MTPQDSVRLLIPDLDVANRLFTDTEILGFLEIYNSSIRRAAAAAIDTVANSEVLLYKVVRTDDLSVNGANVADALRKRANTLRDEAAADDAAMLDEGFALIFPDDCWVVPEGTPRPYVRTVCC